MMRPSNLLHVNLVAPNATIATHSVESISFFACSASSFDANLTKPKPRLLLVSRSLTTTCDRSDDIRRRIGLRYTASSTVPKFWNFSRSVSSFVCQARPLLPESQISIYGSPELTYSPNEQFRHDKVNHLFDLHPTGDKDHSQSACLIRNTIHSTFQWLSFQRVCTRTIRSIILTQQSYIEIMKESKQTPVDSNTSRLQKREASTAKISVEWIGTVDRSQQRRDLFNESVRLIRDQQGILARTQRPRHNDITGDVTITDPTRSFKCPKTELLRPNCRRHARAAGDVKSFTQRMAEQD